MRIIKAFNLEKYNDNKYIEQEDFIFKNITNENYYIALCVELEENEDTEYPSIKLISNLIGKRVYNYRNGNYIKLMIE